MKYTLHHHLLFSFPIIDSSPPSYRLGSNLVLKARSIKLNMAAKLFRLSAYIDRRSSISTTFCSSALFISS
ncbi:hypothetical protein EGR_09969 [Echinococcus granulosus]|uniref:Uncharacterized protein n=1 Tax=Echinococcus granulosus TaxID=6210 RepID=W6U281_ECHGR|nr:hypothetical protein EGR_09969 [Echinococcus granulosus]EUB55168.1 hypothetical protein EGR_09969 [Echinococcus granulosus]